MPSPFPGMDPYLEAPGYWPGLHDRLIIHIADDLQPLLQPSYYVEVGERIYFEQASHAAYPDATLHRVPDRSSGSSRGTAAVAVAPADEPLIVPMAVHRRETFLEIRAAGAGEVVTVLEIVSPANKNPGGRGFEEYQKKQAEVLRSSANMVEIDLLRRGAMVVAVGSGGPPPLRPFDYIACVTRSARQDRCEVYVATVRDRLPRISIPLRDPDPDVVLDIPAIFTLCYDMAGYALRVDYSCPPQIALAADDEAWADAWLAAAGARPGSPS